MEDSLDPELSVIELSPSFHDVWADITQEINVRCTYVDSGNLPGPTSIALVLAAGGEEDRALDLLLDMPISDSVPVYVVGAADSHRFAIETLRRGASDYFALPGDVDLMRRTLASRAQVAAGRLRRSGELRAIEDPFEELVGESVALRDTISKATRVLKHGDVTVLISGETGTGKELLARALHDGGPRASGPFVAVNCAAIPENLLESELFGHERGAFTGADETKAGLFEEADGGTIFLDEVGHLPLALQSKLLRVLEDKQVRRVGGTRSSEIDVRVVAATNVDLEEAVQGGEFRDDLYYRLNVVQLTLPPLRERRDDIELLTNTFVASLSARYQMEPPPLTADLRRALQSYHWPGNVRELRNSIERALLLSAPGTLDAAEMIPRKRQVRESAGDDSHPGMLSGIIHSAVAAAVERHGGNKSAAARELGISRARLQRLLEKSDLESSE